MDNKIDLVGMSSLDTLGGETGADLLGLSNPEVPLLPTAEVKPRAERMDIAMGQDSPGNKELEDRLSREPEGNVRKSLMNTYMNKERIRQETAIVDYIEKARSEGRSLTNLDFKLLMDMKSGRDLQEMTKNPETFIEKRYAKEITDLGLKDTRNNETGKPFDPATENAIKNHIAITEGIERKAQEIGQRYEKESTGTKLSSIGGSLLPVLYWWRTRDITDTLTTSPLLTANNILEQVHEIYKLPVDEAITKFSQAAEDLYQKNPAQAAQFVTAFTSYGQGEAAFDNALQVAGVATGVTAGVAYTLAKNIVLNGAGRGASLSALNAATGRVADAAYQNAKRIFSSAANTAQGRHASDLMRVLPTFANPDRLVTMDAHGFSATYTSRLIDTLKNASTSLLNKASQGILNVTRLAPDTPEWHAAIADTEMLWRRQWNQLTHMVVDVIPVRSQDNALVNTDYIKVRLGDTLAKPIEGQETAEALAKHIGITDYELEEIAPGKFYLNMFKSVDENSNAVRAAMLIDNPREGSTLGRWVRGLTSKDARTTQDVSEETITAVTGAQELANTAAHWYQAALGALPRWRGTSRQDFLNFLELDRAYVDPQTGEIGRYANTLGEFERRWQAVYNRRPTEEEATAYFVNRKISDFEWMINTINKTKMDQSVGMEMHYVRRNDKRLGQGIKGVFRKFVDWTRETDIGIAILQEDNSVRIVRKQWTSQAQRDEIDRMVTEAGWKVLQLETEGDNALRNLPGLHTANNQPIQGRVTYLLTRNLISESLALNQLSYRPGGHRFYRDPYVVAAPIVRTFTGQGGKVVSDYDSDFAIIGARSRQQAVQLAERFEQVRLRLLAGDNQGARRAAAGLPVPYGEIRRMYATGQMDINMPITHKAMGGRTIDQQGIKQSIPNLIDPASHQYRIYNDELIARYAQERDGDLQTAVNVGTNQNPAWAIRPGRLIDPLSAVDHAMHTVANGRFFDDLKARSARRFVAEWADLLEGNTEEIMRHPLHSLVSRPFRKGNDVDANRLALAKNFRRATIETFNSVPEANTSRYYVNRLFDIMANPNDRAVDWVEWVSNTNPSDSFRKWFGFQFKMGFFNPVQFFVQASGIMNTLLLQEADRFNTLAGAYFMRPVAHNPALLDQAANKAVQAGWKNQDHFKEAFRAMMDSGWWRVEDSFADYSSYANLGVSGGGRVKKASDIGLKPFTLGERANRMTAWNAAYLDWRRANPLARFDNAAKKQVLKQADNFTINMTRASSAAWQENKWTAIPTQFFSYHARLMELMLGQKLTIDQKIRLGLGMSVMYGVPSGVAGTTAGVLWPWHQEVREEAIQHGWNIDDPSLQALVDGYPQAIVNAMTGENLNISDRFGPNGLSIVKDFMSSRDDIAKTAYDVALGAVGKPLKTFILDPMAYVLMAPFSETAIEAGVQDFDKLMLDVAREVKTVDSFVIAWGMYNSGAYLARNGKDTIDKGYGLGSALAHGITGLTDQAVSDFYSKVEIKKETENARKYWSDIGVKWYRKALQPGVSFDDMTDYMRKASAAWEAGGLTIQQRLRARKDALNNRETEIEELDRRFRNLDQKQRTLYYDRLTKGN